MTDTKLKKAWQGLDAEVAKAFLEEQKKKDEALMPNVNVGAIVSGNFLMFRKYERMGRAHFYKSEGEKGTYFFEAIAEHLSQTVTAVPVHPFYELIQINKE